jgi:hypothetical protein
LSDGRVDPLVQVLRAGEAKGVIIVKVTDVQGRALSNVRVGLFIDTGPVGWQSISQRAIPRNNGVYEFRRLYAGDYQVRCEETGGYTCEPEATSLYANDSTMEVNLSVTPVRFGRIDFYVHHEDGVVPKFVNIQSTSGDLKAGVIEGRFKTYDRNAVRAGALNNRLTRYRPNVNTGIVPQQVKLGSETRFVFTATREGKHFETEYLFKDDEAPRNQIEIILLASGSDEPSIPNGGALSNLELTLTINGAVRNFERVNLRQTLTDGISRPPQRITGNVYEFLNLNSGTWYLVAESKAYHAAFLSEVVVGKQLKQSIDIKTSHLRVSVAAGASPNSRNLAFRVRLRPRDSGIIEREYTARMEGKENTHMDYIVPNGAYSVWMGDAENSSAVSFSPARQNLKVSNGQRAELNFEVNSASKLMFNCVDENNVPVAYPEFLVSFHPAGSVPEGDKEQTRVGTGNGRCVFPNAPWGPAYLMIWTTSKDWQNPDLVGFLLAA